MCMLIKKTWDCKKDVAKQKYHVALRIAGNNNQSAANRVDWYVRTIISDNLPFNEIACRFHFMNMTMILCKPQWYSVQKIMLTLMDINLMPD